MQDLFSFLTMFAVSIGSVSLGLMFIKLFEQRKLRQSLPKAASLYEIKTRGFVFIFDSTTLIDATPNARALLAGSVNRGGDWNRLIAFLQPFFADIEQKLQNAAVDGVSILHSDDAETRLLQLQIEYRGGLLRLCMLDADQDNVTVSVDPLLHRAAAMELGQLRGVVAKSPMLSWFENAKGQVIWANGAYLFATECILEKDQELSWPLPKLFDAAAMPSAGANIRAKVIPLDGSAQKWYDVSSHDEKLGRLCFATPIDAIVAAEVAQRDFTQSLAKTFAHLPIGLAIFDERRRLKLFNPAFHNMTGLGVEFLTARPSIVAVLDTLRDLRMLPEPKDYRSWRRRLVDFEKAAAAGLYDETWNLPDGQTFKVTARPHPNGALALIFENVSNEMFRSRRYQSDLDLSQSVLDQLDHAVVVFSHSGRAVASNAAYSKLWGYDPAAERSENVSSIVNHWRSKAAPTPVWAEIESYVLMTGDRLPWDAEVRLTDGRLVNCRISPVSGGATLSVFRWKETNAEQPVLQKDMATRKLA
jgi:PAS domain-containing protein